MQLVRIRSGTKRPHRDSGECKRNATHKDGEVLGALRRGVVGVRRLGLRRGDRVRLRPPSDEADERDKGMPGGCAPALCGWRAFVPWLSGAAWLASVTTWSTNIRSVADGR
eukprot:4561975-Prymnesium_polylepis.3